jgi:hypothetical protein
VKWASRSARDQRIAKIILNYIEGILSGSPYLRGLIRNRTADIIELSNCISIEVRPCNYKTLRGPTYIAVVADELAHWYTSVDFANPDIEVLAAVRPGRMTTNGPILMVSSAYAQNGVLCDAYRRDYGADGSPGILVAHGTSRDFNPSLPQAEIDRELERDPVRNRAEYLSEFRSDVEGFIGRDIVEACVGDYRELPFRQGVLYFCFVDASSGTEQGDSFAAAIAHKENDKVVVDAMREVIPPFSPADVVSNTIVPLCKTYGIIDRLHGDGYAGQYPQELCRKAGYQYEVWPKHKSDLYRDMLPAITSRQITLPRHDRLINQTCTLERSVKRSGRDEITHPTHGHDDVINAVAGVLAVVLRQARAVEAERITTFVVPYVFTAGGDYPARPAYEAYIEPSGLIRSTPHGRFP